LDFPAGLPVDQMPQDKVRSLAWFVTGLLVLSGAAMAWLVAGFDISSEKQAEIRERLARIRTQASENSAPAP